MPDTIKAVDPDALAKLAEIPAAGSEGATFDLVLATAKACIQNGAPGLQPQIRTAIARSIAYKLTRVPGTGGIEAAAERIVQRIEDANHYFMCDADKEEAVDIAREEIAALTTGGARHG